MIRWLLRSDRGPLAVDLKRLRLAFLVFGAFNCVTLIAMVMGNAPTATMRLVGVVSAAILAGYWVGGYRHRFFWWLDPVEALLMFGVSIAVGEAERALGVFYVGNFFRSLYDSPRRATIRVAMFYLALASSLFLTPSSMKLPDRIVPHLIGFLFTGLVMQLVAMTVTRHERALLRERTLRQLAVDLAALTEDEDVHRAVVGTLIDLGRDDPTVRGAVLIGTAYEMVNVAADGDHPEDVLGGRFYPIQLPEPLAEELRNGQTIVRHIEDDSLPTATSFVPKAHHAIVPLRVGDDLRGAVVYASDREVPQDLATVLGTLGSQVSVWLGRRAADDAAHRSEERYRSLVQNSTDIVALVDDDAVCTYISPSVKTVLGYEPGDLVGTSGFDFVSQEDIGLIAETFLAALVTPGASGPVEIRAFDVEGRQHWLEIRLTNHLGTDALKGIVVNARDVTEKKSAEEERMRNLVLLRKANDERARLLRHLVVAQEDERKLIAGDIHDDSVQQMAAAAIRLGMLRRYIDDPAGDEVLDKLESAVTGAIDRLRKLMFRLHPVALDRDGLAAAVTEQLNAAAEDAGFTVEVTSSLTIEPPNEERVTAFRIAQEAFQNVRKHSRATHVEVDLCERDGGVYVSVRDDGTGFVTDQVEHSGRAHLGLTSMRERAELSGGWFTITSTQGEGTFVEFLVGGSRADDDDPSVAA